MDARQHEVDLATAPAVASLVRTTAVAFTAIPVVVVTASLLSGEALPIPDPLFFSAAAFGLVVSLLILRLDLEQLVPTVRGRRVVDAYVLALITVTVGLEVTVGHFALAMTISVLVALLGGLIARRLTAVVVLVIAVAGQVVATLRATDPEWVATTSVIAACVVGAVTAWTIRAWNRTVVRGQLDALAQAEQRATGVTVVADVGRRVHLLELEQVLDVVAAASVALGWDECVTFVPVPGTEEHVMLVGRIGRIVRSASPHPDGVVEAVLRSGGNVVVRGYHERDGAHALYGDIAVVVGVPVALDGVPVGALVVGRTEERLEPAEVRLVELLGGQLAAALETLRSFGMQRRAMEEIERASRLKDDFVATVSHEVRTPLHVVVGMAETLDTRWEDLGEEARTALTGGLRRNATDLRDIVEVLLDFSRLDGGQLHVERTATDVAELTARSVERVRALHPEHAVTLSVPEDGDLACAWADRTLTHRVIENLVLNACRHTPAGTTVRVRVSVVADEVEVEVSDDGPGIDPADAARLGQRFHRGGGDHLRRPTRGLGLGLAFCSEVLSLHGTTLEVDSVLGSGATFRFRLPTSHERPDVVASPRTPADTARG